MVTVVPSLPAASFDELLRLARALAGAAPEFQIDIVDGNFVPARSWPFTEDNPQEALARIGELAFDFSLELDCMVMHPEQYLDTALSHGVSRVVVHAGSTGNFAKIAHHVRTRGGRVGLAFTNDAPFDEVDRLVSHVDYLQVMGIREVGKQGQPFDERTPATLARYRSRYPELEIAVDGSVNERTIPSLVAAGATRLAPGSAISRAPDPRTAYLQLRALARESGLV